VQGGFVVKANGIEIGNLLSIDTGSMVVINANNYFFWLPVHASPAEISGVYNSFVYLTNDCSGTKYVRSFQQTFIGAGQVFIDASNSQLSYVGRNVTPILNPPIASFDGGGIFGCSDLSGIAGLLFWPFTANDPSVTGVNSSTFAVPITISR